MGIKGENNIRCVFTSNNRCSVDVYICITNQWYSHTDSRTIIILIFIGDVNLWNSFVLKSTEIALFNIAPSVRFPCAYIK